MEQIYHNRQIDSDIKGYIQQLNYNEKVIIYRVGDVLNDKLIIPKTILPEKIEKVIDISTTPEFEILFILNEDLYDDFLKVKSNMKASLFYKKNNKKYNKQYDFVYNYFSRMSNSEIKNLINLYVKKHGKILNKGQLTLKELIK